MSYKNIILNIAISAVVGGLAGLIVGGWSFGGVIGGADPTGPYIENYVPAIQYGGGLFTGLGIRTDSTLTAVATTSFSTIVGVGTSSPQISPTQGSIVLDGPGTTTLEAYSSTAGRGACIQLRTSANQNVRLWASTTPPDSITGDTAQRFGGLVFESGLCQ